MFSNSAARSCSAWEPISVTPVGSGFRCLAIGIGSGVTGDRFEWTADRIELPAWHFAYPTFPNFCLGQCANEEFLQ